MRRPENGLLGGILGLPTTEWRDLPWSFGEAACAATVQADWAEAGRVEHVFTHFALTLLVLRAEGEMDALWSVDLAGLPSVFAKAAQTARGALL